VSDFKQKVENFFKEVGTDLSDAEKNVVAWFQHIFAKHTAGTTPAAPGDQAGSGSVPAPHPLAAPLPVTPVPVNQAPVPAPNTQAGSGAITPTAVQQESTVTTKTLPADFPKDRISWTEAKWQAEIAAAKKNVVPGRPTVVGDPNYVYAGLVANHAVIKAAGLIPAG